MAAQGIKSDGTESFQVLADKIKSISKGKITTGSVHTSSDGRSTAFTVSGLSFSPNFVAFRGYLDGTGGASGTGETFGGLRYGSFNANAGSVTFGSNYVTCEAFTSWHGGTIYYMVGRIG